jgi:biopolymer transport protein ExbD
LIRQPEATTHAAQPLQKGIGVELPVTSTAVPVPGADKEDAVIVTITQDGSVYFGVNLIRPAALPETIKRGLSNQTENKVYIKADARTPYANLVKVLDAVHTADVKALTLLTAQHDSPEPGTPVPPKGLELLIAPR